MRRVVVHIEQLLLTGVRDLDRAMFAEGVRSALRQQLNAARVAQQMMKLKAAPLLRGHLQVAGRFEPQAVGRAVGRLIVRRDRR